MIYNVSSYTELNAITQKPGDTVLLKAGTSFYGPVNSVSGVTYDKFGTGSKPVLSGFGRSLSNWLKEGAGIYSTLVDVPGKLNIVSVNGQIKPMGRYPRNGVLPYTSYSGTPPRTLITNALGTAVNFIGGEIVIRKIAWVWDRHTITGQAASAVNFSVGTTAAGNNLYSPFFRPGNGFFIQNHINTLRTWGNHRPIFGDWYYNSTSKRLYVYFAAIDPATVDVKAAILNNITSVFGKSNITFNNIKFEGANQNLITSEITTSNKYQGCSFFGAGWSGISGDAFGSGGENNSNEFIDNEFDYCLNEAIRFSYNCNNNILSKNRITNISPFTGSLFPADYGGNAVTLMGNGNHIKRNQINAVGYNGIAWRGNGTLIDENVIRDCCKFKDDGANIYSYNPTREIWFGNYIRKNILYGSNGALLGREGYGDAFGLCACLYFDDGCNGVTVEDNFFTDSTYAGLYVHNSFNITRRNNFYFNNARQIYLQQNQPAGIRDVSGTEERYISKTSGQLAVDILSAIPEPNINLLFGSSDNNQYSGDDKLIKVFNNGVANNLTLNEWKSTSNLDTNST